jgi:TolA-binding protein
MNFVNTSLFVGDLPKFCSESDLQQLFSPFGPLLDAKIKRNSTTGKTLSYGFVTFASEANAQEALKAMDGNMFSGRKLRVRWAMYNAKGTTSTPGSQSQLINSVYVRFVTPMLDRYITEEDLHFVFDGFGNVADASIKESSIDHRQGRQSGYGFVHFSCDQGGIESAFKAVNAVDNANIANVVYNVELSKNLLKLFGEYQQKQQRAGNSASASDAGSELNLQIPLPAAPLNGVENADARYSSLTGAVPPPTTPTFAQHPGLNRSGTHNRSGTLRPASFHDLNSIRTAAAFQQQLQQQQMQIPQMQQQSLQQQQLYLQQQFQQQQFAQKQFSQSQQQQSGLEVGISGGFEDSDMGTRLAVGGRQQQFSVSQQPKLFATRSASRVTNLPAQASPFAFNNLSANSRIHNQMHFAQSSGNSTVQYDYRNIIGGSNGARKFTFDNSHADTVPFDSTGSISRFNSSDSSDINPAIIASQSSDVFRALGAKSNSFMSNSQGSFFSLTEANIQQGNLGIKPLRRGNSNLSEVLSDTDLDVANISLDQKILSNKELDDFLFSASGSNLNSLGSQDAPLSAGARSDLSSSPTKIRDGIASRMEEKKLLGMMPPPIGSPIVMERRSESEFSGYRSRHDSSAANSSNGSRISSFTLGSVSNNNNTNSNSLGIGNAHLALDELRSDDDYHAAATAMLSFGNQGGLSVYSSPNHPHLQLNNNTSSVRYSLEQMSLGSQLDSTLDFPMIGK